MQYSYLFLTVIAITVAVNGFGQLVAAATTSKVAVGNTCSSNSQCSSGLCQPVVFDGSSLNRCCVNVKQSCSGLIDCCGDTDCYPIDGSPYRCCAKIGASCSNRATCCLDYACAVSVTGKATQCCIEAGNAGCLRNDDCCGETSTCDNNVCST